MNIYRVGFPFELGNNNVVKFRGNSAFSLEIIYENPSGTVGTTKQNLFIILIRLYNDQ